MKSKENIVFVGMMGSGKSSVGRLVSKKLNLQFYDIDQIIENELGMRIIKIFETKGERFFREIEEKISIKILRRNTSIISLGGGAFLNKEIRQEVLNNHISIWLKWNNEILLNRIRNNPKRPLAYKVSISELLNLMKKRSKFYNKAMYAIKCDNLSKNKIVKEVLDIYGTEKINN